MMDAGSRFLSYLGLATLLTLSYRLSSFLTLYLRPSQLSRYHHSKPYSTWALVTGASDGIGYGFVTTLLERGFNVLLHGRNQSKLSSIVSDLSAKYPDAEIRYVVADASAQNPDIPSVLKAVESLPAKLTVLINNVGGNPPQEGSRTTFLALQDMKPETIDRSINMNARFSSLLTSALCPGLIRNGPSLIINVGSVTGQAGMPFLSIYSGSKAFNLRFSEALRLDLRVSQTEVLGLLVGNVNSAGNKDAVGLFTPASKQMAGYALDRVGCGRAVVFGYWGHALQSALVDLMPRSIMDSFIKKLIAKRRDGEMKAT